MHKTAQTEPSYVVPSVLQWLLDPQQDWTLPAWTQRFKVYLAEICHMQIAIGLPDPREFSSMPWLKLVQSRIQRYISGQHTETVKIRLPITSTRIREYWLPKSAGPDMRMLWAAVVICFFHFFGSGEITVPNVSSFNPYNHLAWGDVSLDNVLEHTTLIKIHLKNSKTDQSKQGVNVYIGKTSCSLCPVGAGVDYMSIRGSDPGPFFLIHQWSASHKSQIYITCTRCPSRFRSSPQ